MAEHSHSHSHGLAGGWRVWAQDTVLRVVLAAVALAGVATVVGVIALWPSDDGRQTAIANAEELGLASDRFTATVTEISDRRCTNQ